MFIIENLQPSIDKEYLITRFTFRHNDLPWQLRKNYMNQLENVTLDKPNPAFHTDIPRLKKGRVGAQVRRLRLVIMAGEWAWEAKQNLCSYSRVQTMRSGAKDKAIGKRIKVRAHVTASLSLHSCKEASREDPNNGCAGC